MIAWMFMHLLGVRAIGFPEAPLAGQISAGRAVYHSGAGIDRTLGADRFTLGTWFDGRIRRAVDTVTWVSPELVSRWIGYMAERDGWSDAVIDRRWSVSRHQLDRNVTFIVRLAAFPRLDPFEFGLDAPPKPESLRGVRFRLEFSPVGTGLGRREPVVASTLGTCAALFEKEEPAGVTGRPFYSLTQFVPLFLDEGEVDKPDDGIRLGDYYGAVYVMSFPITPAMQHTSEFDLTVQLQTKRESAHFRLFESPWPATSHRGDDE